MSAHRVLVARLDNQGDVLLAGPAVRAVAARAAHVVLLCGPRGRAAADLLPGVDEVLEWNAPWIDPEPEPVKAAHVEALVDAVRGRAVDEAVLLASYHQSSLPLALLLRLAGVPRITAVSEDYPGSLLDVRHRIEDDLPEAERALSTATAAGYPRPAGDDGRLAVRHPLPDISALVGAGGYLVGAGGYVVMHPGASVPARAWSPARCAQTVEALAARGDRVVVTGGPDELALTARVAGRHGLDLGGRTTFAEAAAVLAAARAVVVGNTGPAHLAAAVGTPVVSLFAPTVPAVRWAPYGVPTALLGDQQAPCRGSRARVCPVPGHPCLESITPADVLAALDALAGVAA